MKPAPAAAYPLKRKIDPRPSTFGGTHNNSILPRIPRTKNPPRKTLFYPGKNKKDAVPQVLKSEIKPPGKEEQKIAEPRKTPCETARRSQSAQQFTHNNSHADP
jgi:hypothetical protein